MFTNLNGRLVSCLVAAALIVACTGRPDNDPDRSESEFRDCPDCPGMLRIPAGEFLMGTAAESRLTDPRTGKPATNDGPQHAVRFSSDFAIGKYEVTIDEYAEFVAATNYETVDRCMEFSVPNSFVISKDVSWNNTGLQQSGKHPVTCVSYFDAQAYTDWLSELTGADYRLPTEAEWEYAARAGAGTHYHWGDESRLACDYANVRSAGADAISKRQAESDAEAGFPCDDGFTQTSPVGSFRPNNFGVYDVQGNAWEWVTDCNHKDYVGAPTDGSAWLDPKECRFGIIRGGSFLNLVERSSTTVRAGRPRSGAATNMGFRVARSLGSSAAAAQVNTAATRNPAATTGADLGNSAGAMLFRDNCAACHIDSQRFDGVYGKDLESLVNAIRFGGNNVMSMPAFAERMSAAEIEEVARYIQQVNGW